MKEWWLMREHRLPASVCKAGKGHMAAMERLLAGGSPVEPSADELAHENVAVKMVHKEMSEADEANLLEEEDMHVFDREPLADRLPLVSCNTCRKPMKESQYSAHAERCRSLTAADGTVTEIDGGANHKKPPRKARKKLLVAQDKLLDQATVGERERLQTFDADDATLPDSVGTSACDSQDQLPGRPGFTTPRGQKRIVSHSEGTIVSTPKAGRARKTPLPGSPDGSTSTEDGSGAVTGSTSTLYADSLVSPTKRIKLLRHAELDVMCGVFTEQGAPCRHPLTCKVHCESSKRAVTGRRRPYDVLLQELKVSLNRLRSSKVHDSGVDPLPMTTKVYCLHHHNRMRAVLGNLFREACARDSSRSPHPNAVSSEQGAPTMTLPPVSLDNCVLEASQQGGQSLASDKKMQTLLVTPDGHSSQVADQNRGLASGLMSMPGSHNPLDSKFSSTGTFGPNGQFIFVKSRSVSPLQGVGAGGVFVNGTLQPPFGGVSVT